MKLKADATVQYALGYQEDKKIWWKQKVSLEDLQTPSLYNTYLHTGLPPSPISNPGLASLTAVADINPTIPYLFYIADKSGHIHFARTLEEHNANIEKYLK